MPQSGSLGASQSSSAQPNRTHNTPNAELPSGSEGRRKPSGLPPRTERRKGHKKSRTGCKTCKKRKCDEAKPECGNCIRFGIHCEFSHEPPYIIQPRNAGPRELRCRGRPRADWTSWAEQLHVHADSPAESNSLVSIGTSTGAPSGTSLQPINVEDFGLFHHYITTVAATFGNVSVWRDNAPRLGCEYPCILHGMMALAARHLATLRTAKTPRYLLLADLHFQAAVQGVTQLLPNLNIDNCQPIYVVTALMCITSLARGPAAGELLLVSKGGKVPFFSLFRGLRMVLRNIGVPVVFSGLLNPEGPSWFKPGEHINGACRLTIKEMADWEMSLGRLMELVQGSVEPGLREMYLSQVVSLTALFRDTFGTAAEPKELQHGDLNWVMRWIFKIEDEFVESLEGEEPVALLILGNFSVIIRSLEFYWFMQGWGSHILREVKQMLGEPFEGWLP